MAQASPRTLKRTHALAARLRALSRSPEQRAASGLMVVEGPRLAWEALREGAVIHEVVVSSKPPDDGAHPDLLQGMASRGVYPWTVDDATLGWLADAATPQGILLLVERPRHTAQEIARPASAPLLLVVCGVQDPGNVGALVRLADAAGAKGCLTAGGADPFGPKALRASAGSIFRLPVARREHLEDAAGILAELRAAGYTVAGALARGGEDYRRAMPPPPLALVVGGEAAGLPQEVEKLLDARLTIPTNPRVESLNVATAAAVLLFAAAAGPLTTPRGASPPAAPEARPSRLDEPFSPEPSRRGDGDPSAG